MRAKGLADRKPMLFSWLHRMLLRLERLRDNTHFYRRCPMRRAPAPPGLPKTILTSGMRA